MTRHATSLRSGIRSMMDGYLVNRLPLRGPACTGRQGTGVKMLTDAIQEKYLDGPFTATNVTVGCGGLR